MKKILSLLTILSLAGCEMPDYSQQTVEDKYPADPYVAKEKQTDNSAKSPEKKEVINYKFAQGHTRRRQILQHCPQVSYTRKSRKTL